MNTSELFKQMQPYILKMLSGMGIVSAVGKGFAYTPHALSGGDHTGTASDAQIPQALLRDGSRSLLANMAVAAGVTLDGVDLDVFRSDYDGHIIADSHTMYLRADGTRYVSGHLQPATPDTYDLGSSIRLWRKGYLSELDAILFAQTTITLFGGWAVVGHGEGTLATDVAAAATTIDFGQAMTPNDFVVMRGIGQVEYIQVGTLVSGAVYNVTRNLDGTGANDWPQGEVYLILGHSGDGRIELNAYDTPRISIVRQGAAYNAQTEVARFGDMNGWGSFNTEEYGIGIGDPAAGNFMSYGTSQGFRLRAGGGMVTLNASGIGLTSPTTEQPGDPSSVSFYTSTTLIASLYSWYNTSTFIAGTTLLARMPTGGVKASAVLTGDAYTNSAGGSGNGEVKLLAWGRQATTYQTLSSNLLLLSSTDGSPSADLYVSANDGGYAHLILYRTELQLARNGGASLMILRLTGGQVISGSETPDDGEAILNIATLRNKTSVPTQEASQVKLGSMNGVITARSSVTTMPYSPVTVASVLQNVFAEAVRFAIYGMSTGSGATYYRDLSGMGKHFTSTWVTGYSSDVVYDLKAAPYIRVRLLGTSDYIYYSDVAQIPAYNYFSYSIGWQQDTTGVRYALGLNGTTTPNFQMTVETDNTVKVTYYTSTGQTLSFSTSNTVSTGCNVASFFFAWTAVGSYRIYLWLNGTQTTYSGTAPTAALRTAAGQFRIYNDGTFTPGGTTWYFIFAALHSGEIGGAIGAGLNYLYNLIR